LKVDLCMWTKNGARTLPAVLERINKVIPKEQIGEKYIVDDKSSDNTQRIAHYYDWTVIPNKGTGISDGANTALDLVQTGVFCSFEQDVLVSPSWWNRVSKLMKPDDVAAVSGLRFLPESSFCYNIDSYLLSHNSGDYGKTLDNTLWNAEILKSIGGFPKVSNAFTETILHYKLKELGYQWLVDYNVRSIHLHGGLNDELRHYYFYGANMPELQSKVNLNVNLFSKFLKSPISALRMAMATGDPKLILSYPLCRLAMLGGYLHAS
jgi:glycosyltransferase involved in cell wall biosynthesis